MSGRGQRKPWRRYVGIGEAQWRLDVRKVRYDVESNEAFRALGGTRVPGGCVVPRKSMQVR